jgi:hypothetical protein
MHRRSASADYHHLDTQQSLDHRGSFSSMNSAASPQYYATTPITTQTLLNQQHQILPPPPPNTTQKPAHTNTFVHKLYK